MRAMSPIALLHRSTLNTSPLVRIQCGQGGIALQRKLPIFYSALLLTGVNLVLRMVATSFQVFLSGRIGAAGIGLLQLVMSVGSLSMTLGMAGIRTATMYLTAEELGKKRGYNVTWVLSGCFVYSILCSGIIAVLLYTFSPVIAEHWIGDIRTVNAIRLYSSFLPVTCLCGVMTGYFTAANRIGTLAAVEIAEQGLYMVVTVTILTLWAGSDPSRACESVILGAGISSCVTLCILVILRIRERASTGRRISVRRRLLGIAVPLALGDALKSGISTTENLMVPKRLSLYAGIQSPLAAFGTVCGMVFPVLMFPAAIVFGLAELLIPELARCNAAGSRQRIIYLVNRSLRIVLLFGCLCCGIEYIFAKELCVTLYKSETAGQYLRLYALLIPMLYCDAITDAMIKGLGQQTASVRYNIFTSAMDVALLYLLLPKWGMDGYYISFVVTHLINFLLSLRKLLIAADTRISLHLPIYAIIATTISIACSSLIGTGLLKIPAFLCIFGCCLILFGVISKEDLHWFQGLVQRQ